MIRSITCIALLLIALPAFSQSLQVTDAWIKQLPPSMPMRAGYMQLKNNSRDTRTIISASSGAFKKVEIHESINNNGMMSMRPIKNLVLKAGQITELKPGGLHLMLIKPTQELKIGDSVKVELQFDDDSTQTIPMQIKK